MAIRLLSSRSTIAVYGCLALLLFVGTLRVAHNCGIQSSNGPVSMEAQGVPANASPCSLCFLQAAAVLLLIAVLMYGLTLRERTSFPQFRPRVLLSSFHLDVRPPPFL